MLESINENLLVAAATEPVLPEAAVVEETIPIKQEIIEPVSIKEESIPRATSHLPVTITEEKVEPKQVDSESSDGFTSELQVKTLNDPTTKLEEASVSVEEEILEETIIKISAKEKEMVQSSLMKDVSSSVEESVQETSSVTDAVSAACGSETYLIDTTIEAIIGSYEAQSETAATETTATEDVLLPTGLTVSEVSDSVTTGEVPVYEEQETNIISSEATTITDTVSEKAPITEKHVSETAPSPTVVEELISFEHTAGSVLDASVPVQTFTRLAFDPLLDPLEDTIPVLEPVSIQKPEQKKQFTALPAQPEDILEVVLETEVLSPAAAPAEGNIVEKAGPEGAAQPAEDLEAEMNEEVNIF